MKEMIKKLKENEIYKVVFSYNNPDNGYYMEIVNKDGLLTVLTKALNDTDYILYAYIYVCEWKNGILKNKETISVLLHKDGDWIEENHSDF